MRLFPLPFLCLAVATGQVPHQHHPPTSEEYARVLEDPSRDEWQKPHDEGSLEPTRAKSGCGKLINRGSGG